MVINKDEIESINSDIEEAVSNKNKIENDFSDVYVFVSFDLVNSTKLKYHYPNWLSLIKRLISISNCDGTGLTFWKYNGDEILFYTKIISLNQLAKLMIELHRKAVDLHNQLKQNIIDDENSSYVEDLLGIKTAVWMACLSNKENALNSRLEDVDSVDFAGVNMDEGFRLSKCTIQNKFVVDPKIVLLLCLLSNEYSGHDARDMSEIKKEYITSKKKLKLLTLDEKFALFYHRSSKGDSAPIETESTVKRVADDFRLIGFEKCKGVWGERNYPIIWYSENWSNTIASIKYDEEYLGQPVSKTMINNAYTNDKGTSETLEALKKIYDNVTIFKSAIDEILLNSNFQIYSKSNLDIHIDSRTYIYYSLVCIKKDTEGVLAFLRSDSRGHLPNTWDFEQQKNAQRISGEEVITQIEDKFRSNYGITIKVVKDNNRKSLIPMDIHPIYRRGKLHNGILCFAYIQDELSEEEILKTIESRLSEVVSGYGYPMYSQVKFLHTDNLASDNSHCKIDGHTITELTYNDVLNDSNTWSNHQKRKKIACTTNFILTIKEAIKYKPPGVTEETIDE